MTSSDHKFDRRALIAGAGLGLGLGAGLISVLAPQAAQAAEIKAADLWSGEYTVKKGDVSLVVYRKRQGAPKAGEAAKTVLFLVHGSSYSARAAFDLPVPGHDDYSLMNVFASYGYDVWTVDHENYGKSSQTASNSDIASGVEDLKVVMEFVVKETGQQKVYMYGQSSGALRAGGYAMVRPDRISRLVLGALTYKGEGSPTLTERAKQVEYYRTHNRRTRDRDMIRSIFTRDREGTADPVVAEALADFELQFGDQVPTGTYLDMTANLPVVHPEKIECPVMLVRGVHDGIATLDDIFDFFGKLPNGDRQIALLPATAHSLTFGNNRRQFWHVMQAFFTLPVGDTV